MFDFMETKIYSLKFLFKYLDNKCFIWGSDGHKKKSLIKIGWDARQHEIDELKQEISQLKQKGVK